MTASYKFRPARCAMLARMAGLRIRSLETPPAAEARSDSRVDYDVACLSNQLLALAGQGRRLDELTVGVVQPAGPDETVAL